jgi:hypothetical protein
MGVNCCSQAGEDFEPMTLPFLRVLPPLTKFEIKHLPFQTLLCSAFIRYVNEGASSEGTKEPYITIGQLKSKLVHKHHWATAFAKNETCPFYILIKHQFMHAATKTEEEAKNTDEIKLSAFKLVCLGILYCRGTALQKAEAFHQLVNED